MNSSHSRPRVLCVDDNSELLPVLEMGLTADGFEVIAATSAAEALAKFETYHGDFNCVLTDHDMPGGSGSELSRQLRAAGYTGRIIVMSGRLTEKDLGSYHDLSISGFFRKPFALKMLLAVLGGAARASDADEEIRVSGH